MRPDRRFGGGRAVVMRLALAWLAVAASAATVLGQDWKTEPIDPKGHSADVVAVAISRDGKTVATAGLDGRAKVWDIDLGPRIRFRADLDGHAGKVLSVVISPDGKIVATGGEDRTVRLWDAAKGTPLATLPGHSGIVEALAISPDGKTLASSGTDTAIRLWDVSEKRTVRTLQGHEKGVRGLAFSPDGKSLASAGRDHQVKLWDVVAGTERLTLGHHDAPAWCVAFSPDGQTVASGGLDKTVRLWRTVPLLVPQPSQPQPPDAPDLPPPAEPGGAVVGPRVRLREVTQAVGRPPVQEEVIVQQPGLPPVQVREQVIVQQPGLPGAVFGGAMGTSQGQPQPNQVNVWQVEGGVMAVAFTPDGQHLAAAVSDLGASRTTPGLVAFFPIPHPPNLNPNQPQAPTPPSPFVAKIRGHLGPVWSLAIRPDGTNLVTVGGDASVRLWEAIGGKPLAASVGPRDPGPVEKRVMAHLDPVEALAISPDGTRVVTATESAGVTLWDAVHRSIIGRLRDPAGPVRAVALSPDGKILATGGDGKAVSLWNAATGLPIDKLKGHEGAITALAFSPDGKTLASGSKDASITLWDVARKAEIVTLARHTSSVTCLAFSADGTMLATGALDYTVKLWEVPSGQYRDTFEGHKDVVDAVAFAPDGSTLASGDRTGTVRTWDVAKRAEKLAIQALTAPVRALAFAPDGKTLIGAGDDSSIRRWDAVDGKVVALRPGAHTGPIRALAIGSGGKTLATGGDDRELKLWDVAARLAPGPFADLEGKVRQLAIAPDGKSLATGSSDYLVRIWDVDTGRERTPPIHFEGGAVRLDFSPDSETLATLPVKTAADAAKLWDVASGRMKAHSELNTDDGWAVAISPDGRSWATSDKTTIHVWGLATSRQVRDFSGASGPIRSIAFSPDGQRLAAGSLNGAVTTWDVADNKKFRAIFKPSTRSIAAIAFLPDGKTLAIAGEDRVVRLLDAATGEVRITLRGPKKPITGLAIVPDGQTIASASDGESILFVWRVADGRVVSTPTLADASVGEGFACVAFAPDGRTLYAGGDRGVSTFDMTEGHRPPSVVAASEPRKGQERATLRGHAEAVRSLTFLENGSRLATRSEDGVVKVWDLPDGRDRLTLGGGEVKIRAMAPSPDGHSLAAGLRPLKAQTPPADSAPAPGEPPPDAVPATVPAPAPSGPPTRPAPSPSLAPPGGETAGTTDLREALITALNSWTFYVLLATPAPMSFIQAPAPVPPQGPAPAPPPPQGPVPAPAPAEAPPVQDPPRTPTQAPATVPYEEVRVWSLDKGDVRGKIEGKATAGNGDVVVALVQSPDGKTMATASRSGVVKVWDAATLAAKAEMTKREGDRNHAGVDVILFAAEGKTLVGANAAGLVTLWDTETGQIRASFHHEGGMNQIIASPDGKLLATGGGKLARSAVRGSSPDPSGESGGDVRLWDMATARRVAVLPMPSGNVVRLAFSPDGKILAASTEAPVATLWNVAEAAPMVSIVGPSGVLQYLAFSPDGKTLAAGGEDETLHLWDVPTGTLRAALAGHADAITWVAFSPDGKTLATASRDATVKLWDVPAGSAPGRN